MLIIKPTVLATMMWITDSGVSAHFMLHLVGNRLVGTCVLLKNPPVVSELVLYSNVS